MFKPGTWAKGFEAMKAKGRLKAGDMNKLEAEYDLSLRARLQAGDIAWYVFHGIKLRIGDGVFYEPDFAVMNTSGMLEIHETKGFVMGDAMNKVRIAKTMYPFRFLVIRKRLVREGGGFRTEEV